ncbi:MAG: VWA domain-containing protein [Melioribacteraceae bacterium]|nr:VWA domain-containing protein [Melioribacteraceae bacterium]
MNNFLRALTVFFIAVAISSCSLGPDDDDNNEIIDLTLPHAPTPENNVQNQDLVATLSWQFEGADTYDIYFGETTPPRSLIAANLDRRSFIVPGLNYSTRYYWQVIARMPNGRKVEGPIWSFVTKPRGTTDEGYVLIEYGLETELPSFVNVYFQVLDLNGIGVDNLTSADFEVYEDGEVLSIAESQLQIIKSDQLPYTLQLVLMLDNSTSLLNELDDIILAASNFVNSLTVNFEMAVYKFSEDPILIQDFTSDKAVLSNAINDIRNDVFETTDLYGAVIEGSDKMEESFDREEIIQSAMVIFTDGDDTQAEHTLSEALNAASGKRIYSVGLGSGYKTGSIRKNRQRRFLCD